MPVPSWLLERKEREIQQALLNLRTLPDVKRSEVADEESCPICLLPLESIFEEHETIGGKEEGSSCLSSDNASGTALPMTGVVKLTSCGHFFCRKDLAEWMKSHHGCCPICRRTFFDFTPVDEAEYESSDGGEYIPEEDDDYDVFTDEADHDLVASSDFDTEMDEYDEEEEDEDDFERVVPLSQPYPTTGANVDGSTSIHNHISLAYSPHPSINSRSYSSELESNVIEACSDGLEEAGELSYGSDSPSSGGSSSNIEDGPEACVADISFASDDFEISNQMSRHVRHTEVKSPSVHGTEASAALDNNVSHQK